MSCASKSGLGLSSTFRTSSQQSQILSKPLCSVVPTAFFLFWVKLWVKRYQVTQKLLRRKQRKSSRTAGKSMPRRKPLAAEQRFFSLPLLKLQPARLSSGFGRFDNSPESPLVAPVKPYAPFYWQGWERDPLRRLMPVCAALEVSALWGVEGGLPTSG